MQTQMCNMNLFCENSTAEYILLCDNSGSHITGTINKCLLDSLKEKKGFVSTKAGCRGGVSGDNSINKWRQSFPSRRFMLFFFFKHSCMITWATCHHAALAAWCYQKINPPMARFKARATPRLQLITSESPALSARPLSHPLLKVGLRQGLKGLLCAGRNKDGSRLLMKVFQEGYLHILKEDFLLHSNRRLAFRPLWCDAKLAF